VAQDFKVRVVEQVFDVSAAAGEKVVGADNIRPFFDQRLAEVGAEKARAAGDQYAFIEVVFLHGWFILTFQKLQDITVYPL